MATADPDPSWLHGDHFDPLVRAGVGAWTLRLGPDAVRAPDSVLEGWIGSFSEADLHTLASVYESPSGWNDRTPRQAGRALAAWERIEGAKADEWREKYYRLLGAQVRSEVDAWRHFHAAEFRVDEAQAEATVEQARDPRTDRPTFFTELEPGCDALERGAHYLAAAREQRSRNLGITLGPLEHDPSLAFLGGSYEDPSIESQSTPVRDPKAAMAVCADQLRGLRAGQGPVALHAAAIVGSVKPRNLRSLGNLQADLERELPEAARLAAGEPPRMPPGLGDSMLREGWQRGATDLRSTHMARAGELQWGDGPRDRVERRTQVRQALAAADEQKARVEEYEADLQQHRARGYDYGTWLAREGDHLARGHALNAVRTDLELARDRDVQIDPPEADLGFDR